MHITNKLSKLVDESSGITKAFSMSLHMAAVDIIEAIKTGNYGDDYKSAWAWVFWNDNNAHLLSFTSCCEQFSLKPKFLRDEIRRCVEECSEGLLIRPPLPYEPPEFGEKQ